MKYNSKGKGNGTPRTHGMTQTRTYRASVEMKRRCKGHHPSTDKHYSDKGIKVCARWERFEDFLADMGECPPGLSLDRKDSDGNYEHGNCRWTTIQEQQNNRSSNVRLMIDGVTHTLTEWARLNDLPPRCVAQRIRRGIDPRAAISAPSNRSHKLCA